MLHGGGCFKAIPARTAKHTHRRELRRPSTICWGKKYPKLIEKACPWTCQNRILSIGIVVFSRCTPFLRQSPEGKGFWSQLASILAPWAASNAHLKGSQGLLDEHLFLMIFSRASRCVLSGQLGGQKVFQQPQKAARRLSGEGGGRRQNRPKSENPPKTRQTPRKGAAWPPPGTTFSIILSFYFDILDSAPSHFVESCWVFRKHVNAMFLDSFHTSLYQIGTFSAYSCAY